MDQYGFSVHSSGLVLTAIVMEYLGGGSCLDLVCDNSPLAM